MITDFQSKIGKVKGSEYRDGRGARRGRVIFYVDDVDHLYQQLVDAGVNPSTAPQDAPWRERYFHVNDPDGHELSFAKPILSDPATL